MRLLLLICLLGSFLPLAVAKEFSEPRAKWLTSFRKELKSELCDPSSFIRRCTKAEVNSCNKEVSTALSKCVSNSELPKRIDPLVEGIGMGKSLGRCVGVRLAKKFNVKPNQEKCRSVAGN